MARIAALSIGMYGHLAPLARVAKVMSGAGHTVIAWAPAEYRADIEASGARLVAHEPLPGRTPDFDLRDLAAGLAEATERCTERLAEELLAERIELVVHDLHVPWARVAADFLGLPRIMTTPLFPVPLTPGPSRPPEARSTAGYAAAALARVERSRAAVRRRWDVDLGSWREVIYNRAPATLCLTTEELAGHRRLAAGWQYVGPLLDPPPPRSPAGSRPFVYTSFGTFFHGRPEPPRAVVEALAQEPVDLLISTGRTRVSPDSLGPLPANAVVREFVSAREVLSRADVFITHAGSSSVHEALMAGVPMVCIPQFADQFDWARRVEALGAGRMIDHRGPAIREAIRAAFRQVLGDDRYRETARQIGARLAATEGRAEALELVDRLIGAARSSELDT